MAFPTLNNNIFYASLVNGFKYMTTVADALSGMEDSLVSKYKIDGGEFQDQLVYTDMDCIKSYVWDPTDTNVLTPGSKVLPVQQAIPIDQKRQINLYVDNGYLSKRVWMGAGSWEGFRSVIVSQISNTKKIYDQKMVYTAIGTMKADFQYTYTYKDSSGVIQTVTKTNTGLKQAQTVTLPAIADSDTDAVKESKEKRRARLIGKKISDVFVDMKDTGRDFNDFGFMKSFDEGSCTIIWNKDYVNEFEYVDLPLLYGNAGKTQSFEGVQIPGLYFGTKNSTAVLPASITANKYRSCKEMDVATGAGQAVTHVFPGDYIPAGSTEVLTYNTNGTAATVAANLPIGEGYEVDTKTICKIVHNDAIVYPVSWLTDTEFFNAKNLSTNYYETWYYGNPAHRKSYPLITITEVNPE